MNFETIAFPKAQELRNSRGKVIPNVRLGVVMVRSDAQLLLTAV